jgi:hypothetical protein
MHQALLHQKIGGHIPHQLKDANLSLAFLQEPLHQFWVLRPKLIDSKSQCYSSAIIVLF